MFNRIAKAVTSVTVIAAIGLGTALAQTPPKTKAVKDQVEFDLYTKATTTASPAERLPVLDSWKEKYPDSDFKEERLVLYLASYQVLNQVPKAVESAKAILEINPKEVNALMFLTRYGQISPSTPDSLATGEKAARALNDAEKPANLPDAQWTGIKASFPLLVHRTLGYIASDRKQPDVAEQEYIKALNIDPTQAQTAYDVGRQILAQKKTERYPDALFYLARAASLGGPGALPPALQKQVDAYFVKSYEAFHGKDDEGLKGLRQLAVGPKPAPPEGFKIKNINEIAEEKAAQIAKDNPELAIWRNLRDALTAPNGNEYWETGFKGSDAPKFHGTLVSMSPAVRPKELVLSIDAPDKGDVTLKFDAPLAGKADVGTKIGFKGVPSAFTKEPFMVTFDVEKEALEGWPVQAAPPAKKAPATKKSKK